MPSFTPGPWVYALDTGPIGTELPCITTVARCAQFVIGLASDVPGGNYRDGDPSGDEEADARLIAAAPLMLEALQLIASAKSRGFGIDYATGCACTAISKATGA